MATARATAGVTAAAGRARSRLAMAAVRADAAAATAAAHAHPAGRVRPLRAHPGDGGCRGGATGPAACSCSRATGSAAGTGLRASFRATGPPHLPTAAALWVRRSASHGGGAAWSRRRRRAPVGATWRGPVERPVTPRSALRRILTATGHVWHPYAAMPPAQRRTWWTARRGCGCGWPTAGNWSTGCRPGGRRSTVPAPGAGRGGHRPARPDEPRDVRRAHPRAGGRLARRWSS